MKYTLLIYIAFLIGLSGCSSGDGSPTSDGQTATPRRAAFPRPNLYDTLYRPIDIEGLEVSINTAATVDYDSTKHWLTISYPRYKAKIYCTLTQAATPRALADAIDNRTERMSLNVGGQRFTTETFTTGRFTHTLVEAAGARNTPLQFISTDDAKLMLSGQVVFEGIDSHAPVDSLSPIVAALRTDIIRLLPR